MLLKHCQTSWHFIWRESTLHQAMAFIERDREINDDSSHAWRYKIRPRIIRKYGGFPYMMHWDIYERYYPHKWKPHD